MSYEVKGRIFEGVVKPQNVTVNIEDCVIGLCEALTTRTYDIPCDRCGSRYAYLCMHEGNYVSFCGEKECLTADANASRKLERDKCLYRD